MSESGDMGVYLDKLSVNNQLFVSEYIISENLAKSAKAANSKAKNLSQAGKQILNRKDVTLAVAEMKKEVSETVVEKLEISAETVIEKIATIALADLSSLYDEYGKPIKGKVLTRSQRQALGLKPVDQAKAMEMLARHMGLFGADNDQKKYMDVPIEELLEQRKAVAKKIGEAT